MTQAIAKYAAKKMLSSELNKYKGKPVDSQYDPFYELVPHPRKPGKTKKVKKQIPAWLPEHDAEILARARKTAYRLDFCLFNFLGFRFGWSSVIGLVPVVGDILDGLLAVRLISAMAKVEGGLPQTIKVWMLINLAIDFLVGLIPFVGDLADAAIKCNSKNVRLLEQHLDKRYKPQYLKDQEDKLAKDKGSRPAPATVYEDFSDEEEERRNTFNNRHDGVRQPKRAYSGRRERIPDEEMGVRRQGTQQSYGDVRPSHNNARSGRR